MATALLVAVVSCAGSVPEVPVGPDGTVDPVLELGRAVYSRSCRQCHGSDGDGGSGPKLRGNEFDEDFSEMADLIDMIARGEGRMPAFESRLTEAQMEAVSRYVREVL